MPSRYQNLLSQSEGESLLLDRQGGSSGPCDSFLERNSVISTKADLPRRSKSHNPCPPMGVHLLNRHHLNLKNDQASGTQYPSVGAPTAERVDVRCIPLALCQCGAGSKKSRSHHGRQSPSGAQRVSSTCRAYTFISISY